MTPTQGRKILNSAAKYLAENYDFRAQAAIVILNDAHTRLTAERKASREQPIPVYRMYQSSMVSPCLIGDPCSVCAAHVECRSGRQCQDCRRGKTLCLRATPAEPAFTLTFTKAMIFVRHGLATFINGNKALRLTFSKISQLRDQSLKITEQLLIAYADDSLFRSSEGERGSPNARARNAVTFWGNICGDYAEWTPKQMEASRQRIQCFT